MKQSAIAAALVLILSGLLWLLLPRRHSVDGWIPSDAMALLVLNQIPDSLDFIEETRLKNWLDVDTGKLAGKIVTSDYVHELSACLDGAWIVLHAIQPKENGSYRIGFSAFLFPRQFQYERVRRILVQAVKERFGSIVEEQQLEGLVEVIRGELPGEIFYITEIESCLLVSNIESGWKSVLARRQGVGEGLREQADFRDICRAVGIDSDVFLYFRGAGDLVPKFGYAIDLRSSGDIKDRYFEIPARETPE